MVKKRKILIIEDDKDISRTIDMHLQANGFDTLISHDGEEGLKMARDQRPDVILLDLGLPNLPGEEICRQLKKDDDHKDVPIIMLTAKVSDTDKVIGRVIGAEAYLKKPFDLDTLLKKINNAISKITLKEKSDFPEAVKEDFPGKRQKLINLINYQSGSIVSREILRKDSGTVTVFAFDKGEGLSEHTAPYDALVCAIDGEAEIIISGDPVRLRTGELIIMPANKPHSLKAVKQFKMLLIMLKA